MSINFTMGADPEFFLYDKTTKVYKSAHNVLPGTKGNPYKLTYGAVQVDGTAVEFNINPAKTGEEFAFNINETLKEIRTLVPSNYSFSYKPTVVYPASYWDDLPDLTKEIGCDPDYMSTCTRPTKASAPPNGRMRHGGGHIHLGWKNPNTGMSVSHLWDARQIARQFYNTIRLFICKYRIFEPDLDRKANVPLAAYRPKPYGTECRGLSNNWLNYPLLYNWLFNTSKKVVELFYEGKSTHELTYIAGSWYDYPTISYNNALNKYKLFDLPNNWSKHGQSVS